MRLTLHSVFTSTIPNLRTWQPEHSYDVFQTVCLEISTGPKRRGIDIFTVTVATPRGLMDRPADEGIIFSGPIVVLESYDFDVLWKWLQDKVNASTAETWEASVERLRRWFRWEYDYTQQ